MTRPATREWKIGKEFWCRLSPTVPLTSYIRFALHHKCISVWMVWVETPILIPNMLVLQYGFDTVSGSGETLMQYIESRFPRSSLVMSRRGDWDDSTVESLRIEVKKFGRSYGHLVRWCWRWKKTIFFSMCGGWPSRKRRVYWTLKNSSTQSAWNPYYFWD